LALLAHVSVAIALAASTVAICTGSPYTDRLPGVGFALSCWYVSVRAFWPPLVHAAGFSYTRAAVSATWWTVCTEQRRGAIGIRSGPAARPAGRMLRVCLQNVVTHRVYGDGVKQRATLTRDGSARDP
jgi:hypothetical protein